MNNSVSVTLHYWVLKCGQTDEKDMNSSVSVMSQSWLPGYLSVGKTDQKDVDSRVSDVTINTGVLKCGQD